MGRGRAPWLFIAGWTLLAAALISPLCRLAAGLASAHMAQHMILVALAPPLLVLGEAGPVIARALGRRRSEAREIGPGALALTTAAHGVAIWLWHLPAAYEAVGRNASPHVAAVAGLIAASLWFWSAVLGPARSGGGAAGLALLVTTIHTGFLGALLTISPAPWFPSAADGSLWGLSALEDQQLAGLIMWVPMAAVYLGAGLARVRGMLSEPAPARPA